MSWVALCLGALALSLVGEVTGRAPLRAVGKTVASLSFVAYALHRGVPAQAPHGAAVLAALLLSVVGDVALLGESKRAVLGGIAAFLLAHVAYVVAFVQLGPALPGVAAAALVVAPFGLWMQRRLAAGAGGLAPAVGAYIVVISAMVALATGVAWRGGEGAVLVLVAAVLFFVSDLFVARQRFVVRSSINRVVGLPIYYVAQLLFVEASTRVGVMGP